MIELEFDSKLVLQNRLKANRFIKKISRFELAGLSHSSAMLVKYHKVWRKRKTTDELKVTLQSADHLGRTVTRTC